MTSRVNLTEQDIQSVLDADAAYEQKIPILKRRADAQGSGSARRDPICVIVVGMAGSGKTTLMAQLQESLGLMGGDGDVNDVSDFASTLFACLMVWHRRCWNHLSSTRHLSP